MAFKEHKGIIMKLLTLLEDQGMIVRDQVREVLSQVGHEANTQGAPDSIRDKRYGQEVNPEEAWRYGVSWVLERIDELLSKREL